MARRCDRWKWEIQEEQQHGISDSNSTAPGATTKAKFNNSSYNNNQKNNSSNDKKKLNNSSYNKRKLNGSSSNNNFLK